MCVWQCASPVTTCIELAPRIKERVGIEFCSVLQCACCNVCACVAVCLPHDYLRWVSARNRRAEFCYISALYSFSVFNLILSWLLRIRQDERDCQYGIVSMVSYLWYRVGCELTCVLNWEVSWLSVVNWVAWWLSKNRQDGRDGYCGVVLLSAVHLFCTAAGVGMYTYIFRNTHTHIHACRHVTHTYKHIHTHEYLFSVLLFGATAGVGMCIYIYIHTHTLTLICIHIHIIHIHFFIHV